MVVSSPKGFLLAIFCFIAAAMNVVILLGTMRKVSSAEASRSYSYIDGDYPVEIPVGAVPTVEMTFHEASRFGLSDNDSFANWETLYTNQFGIGFQHLGPYHFRFISGGYHSLHCLYTMRLAFERPHHIENPDSHFVHCLIYMRQLFLCDADLTLEAGDFMARNLTTDRVGTTRRCRDWSMVAEWVNENSREWVKYNGVSLDI